MRNRYLALATTVIVAVALAGCTVTPAPSMPPSPSVTTAPDAGSVTPVGTPKVLASNLKAPWSVVRLSSGSALISERDTAAIIELTPEGKTRTAGTVAGVAAQGEGGLLGLAITEEGDAITLYAYLTSASDNRIVRMPLEGSPGDYTLGKPESILRGLSKSGNHNGGRIAFGPDGKLYATVGDAGQPDRAQSMTSLNGKILRMNPDGSVPSDNPFPSSLIYTLGHRNPQGISWDAAGQLWASEFGQNTWDEFNQIDAGKNYGWPTVEGKSGKVEFVDPVLQWTTAEASPSGLAFVSGTFFMAALRGARLWSIHPAAAPHEEPAAQAWFTNEYGRLRDAAAGPNGTLWVLTNNTDGRGSPQHGDDKLLEVTLAPRTTP